MLWAELFFRKWAGKKNTHNEHIVKQSTYNSIRMMWWAKNMHQAWQLRIMEQSHSIDKFNRFINSIHLLIDLNIFTNTNQKMEKTKTYSNE